MNTENIISFIPSTCPNCKTALDDVGVIDWILVDQSYTSSNIVKTFKCPVCGAEYKRISKKMCPITHHKCIGDECMWWVRPVEKGKYNDGKCGIIPMSGGI